MEREVIFSNYDMEPFAEMAKEELKDINGEDYEMSDDEVGEFAHSIMDEEWEYINNVLRNTLNNKNCIFYGTIGAWDNDYEGGQIGSFEELFPKATEDCWYWELAFEDKELKLKCSHHDGTNHFTIKVVTDEGMDYFQKWQYWEIDKDLPLEDCHKKIIENYTEDVVLEY